MAEIPGTSNLTASADAVTTTVTQNVACVQSYCAIYIPFRLLDSLKRAQFLSFFVQSARNRYATDVSVQKRSPLEGIKILDLTRIVAGPYCSMVLGDLGAEVIKIEQPKVGDECRRWGPLAGETGLSCYFVSLNRNKKSVCVNLKAASGRAIIMELAKKCDVLIENYIPGKLDSLGLGFKELKTIAPRLVYCSITGYGQKGPYKLRSGVDVIAASYGGLLHLTGPKDGSPCRAGVPLTDIATGIYAYGAIMTALFQREKTGVGQKIDCDLLSTQISCLISSASSYLNANQEVHRLGSAQAHIVPYQVFLTADGFITICAFSNDQFVNLCKALELHHLLSDKRFATNSTRVRNREILVKILNETFATKPTKQWLTILEGCSFSYGPVNSISEVFEDEHVKEIGIVKEMLMNSGKVEEGKESTAKIKLVGPAVDFSSSENTVRFPPPLLGQHTKDVLKHVLNYSDDRIESLIRSGDIS